VKNLKNYQKKKLEEMNLVHVIQGKNISTVMVHYDNIKPIIIKTNIEIPR